jgi:hypothetical protein
MGTCPLLSFNFLFFRFLLFLALGLVLLALPDGVVFEHLGMLSFQLVVPLVVQLREVLDPFN